jgi:carbon storage regulator
MLVLGRTKGESIRIGRDVEVTVLAVRGDRVRLGIVAPGEVRILRTELFDRTSDGEEERTGEAA